MSESAAPEPSRRSFYLRKLHSLSGIVPVGAFMCFHLYENHSAVHGPEAFDAVVTKINDMPFVLGLEILGIWIPIAFHAGLGMVIIFEGKSNVSHYPWGRNWLYWLQRATGIIALLFIVFHFVNFRAMAREEFLPEHGNSPFRIVQDQLAASWWVLPFYVLGLAASIFHFANGLTGFLFSWGFTVGPRSKRFAGWAAAGVGVAVFALGMQALFAFV